MTSSNYQPEPGSLAAKVLALFARNRDQRYTHGQLANLVSSAPMALSAALTSPLTIGLLVYERKLSETVEHYGAGPKLSPWLQEHGVPPTTAQPAGRPHAAAPAQPPAAAPATATAQPTAKRATGDARPSKQIDLATLKVHKHRPLPAIDLSPPRRQSIYARIWHEVLTEKGDSVDLTKRQALSMAQWARKHKHKVLVRKLDGDLYGVWRDC